MNRREFVKGVAAGLVVGTSLARAAAGRLPMRALGRTGIQVPIIGFGSGSRFLMYGLLYLMAAFFIAGAQAGERDLREQFQHPGADRATVPFWHLNGKLSKGEITRQLGDAKHSGFSGVATLPVSTHGKSPATEPGFLSEGFFELYGHLLDEAKRLGLQTIFYDDLDFPSGSAAGKFREKYPQHVMKSLFRDERELKPGDEYVFTPSTGEELMSAMAYRANSGVQADLWPANGKEIRWKAPSDGWRVTVCTLKDTGCAYVDYLDSEACDRFIELTYEVFYQRFPAHFGTTIRQVFFDDVSMCHAGESRAWTRGFNESFKKRLGYDPAPLYPALWHEIGPETAAARVALFGHRAWMMANEGFPARVNAWSRKHKVKSSGHTTSNYALSPVSSGGDYMLFGSNNDSPLLDSIHFYGHGRSGFQLTSSAAYNFDKPRCTVEIYGNYRLPFPPDMLFRSGMELFTRGANFLIPHGMWYSYGPEQIHIQPLISPYNPEIAATLPAYNQWAARHQILLEGGRHISDIAVLYPIEGLYASYRFDRFRKMGREYGDEGLPLFDYLILSDQLQTRCHRDFTFLHPSALAARCQVTSQGELKLDNPVNWESYSVLVIPSTVCLSEATLEKARAFAEAGGLVIATGQLPWFADQVGRGEAVRARVKALFGLEPRDLLPQFGDRTMMSDGRDLDDETRRIFEGFGGYASRSVGDKGGRAVYIPAISPELLEKALAESRETPDVKFAGASSQIAGMGVFGYTHKVKDGLDLYQFANSTDDEIRTKVTLRGGFKTLELWNPKTGGILPLASRAAKDARGREITEAELVLRPVTDVFWVGKRE